MWGKVRLGVRLYSSSNVRNVNNNGNMEDTLSTNNVGIRPVIYLKSNITFTGGKGTAQSPYELQKKRKINMKLKKDLVKVY